MRKIILFISAFIINLFIINYASAENFVINSYKVNMNITENRTAEISERINVFFTRESHGIYRSIPIKNTITRNDGTKNIEFARITDINASQLHSKSITKNKLILKMGNPNYYANPNSTYDIKYKYNMGNDNVKDADEFYFNIIGTEWDTTISKVYFSITLPKEFDASKVGFSVGRNGAIGYNPETLKFNISGNTITGYTTTKLNPNEGITVRIELPENYFVKTMGIKEFIALLSLILTAISVILWAMFGKDSPVTPIVNFDIPEGKNSAEIEVEYSGISTNKGITSLIFYLASKGYLEIEDDGIQYRIKKLKPYDGDKANERALMDALFYKGDEISQRQLERSSAFSNYCQKIQKSLNKIRNFLFEKESCSFEKLTIMIVSIIGLIAIMLYTLSDYSFNLIIGEMGFLIIFPILAVFVMTALIRQGNVFFAFIWGLPFGGIPLIMLLAEAPNINSNYPMFILEVVCLVVSVICLINMPKRNNQGRMLLGQILGLKKYLEVVEKPRLIAQINENPNYVSEILPFAYVLGAADNLIDCIEDNAAYQPSWYHGNFNKGSFHSFSRSLESASSPPSSSGHHGGSGHSGGGHSGGGHGGGGGGSW